MSFVTNTNWQAYSGEVTMSHLTQMAGLAFHNFVSAACGAAVAIALVRGLTRRRTDTIGNFWVDLVRICTRVLLPFAFVGALVLVSQGVIQNFHGARTVATVEGGEQSITGGPIASQEVIKEIGQNGGGPYNANSAHPFENPNPITNIVQLWLILAVPFAFPWMYGILAKDRRQGYVVLGGHGRPVAGRRASSPCRSRPAATPTSPPSAPTRRVTATQSGGNMEGKETRFGPAASGLFASSTTGTSTGAVNSMHDSFTPIGGAVPLVNMMLGEVSPGGTGSGLYGMLVFALLERVHRRADGRAHARIPGQEDPGPGDEAGGALHPLRPDRDPDLRRHLGGDEDLARSLANDGPHGLTEMTYAFTSAANNNGSAFGGLAANTNWFNTTLGICMLVGRFFLMVPVLAIAGSLGRKQPVPVSAGTFPTGTPLFAGLLTAVVLIVVGLTYFPVVALGPAVEHLVGKF